MSKWLVETGKLKVKVLAENVSDAMTKAVFNSKNVPMGIFISAVKLPYKNKKTEELWFITEKVIERIDKTLDERMNIGIDILVEIRTGLEMDKAEFSRKCKIHVETIRKIENRRMKLHYSILEKILANLGITIDDYMKRVDEKHQLLINKN